MRAWIIPLLLGLVAGAGCLDDSEADEPMDDMDNMDNMDGMDDTGNITLEYSFGPSLGCTGDIPQTATGEAMCVGTLTGQDGLDGYFVALEPGHIGMAFTTTVENALGDSDCWFLDADGAILGDANQGQGPCSGVVPDGTANIYLYSYAEPATGMTLTFTP